MCVYSLSVHWLLLTFFTLILCQEKQKQAPSGRGERDICKYGETSFHYILSFPPFFVSSLHFNICHCSFSSELSTDAHAYVCMCYVCINKSMCARQQGTLRHPKLNSMSKSDTRLHEINRFPCNGNCKWRLTALK